MLNNYIYLLRKNKFLTFQPFTNVIALLFSLTAFKAINVVFLVGIVRYPSVKKQRKLAITGQLPTTKKKS